MITIILHFGILLYAGVIHPACKVSLKRIAQVGTVLKFHYERLQSVSSICEGGILSSPLSLDADVLVVTLCKIRRQGLVHQELLLVV